MIKPDIRVYRPESGMESETIGVVMTGPIGSNNANDGGRDGAHLAEELGLTVVTFSRLGAQNSVLSMPGTARRLRRDTVAAHSKLSHEVNSVLETEGIEEVLGVGRSMGGTAILASALTDQINYAGLYLAEPGGWLKAGKIEAVKHFFEYDGKQGAGLELVPEQNRPEDTDTTGLTKVRRMLSIATLGPRDILTNIDVLRTDFARRSVRTLLERGGVIMRIDFASNSKVIDEETFNQAHQEFASFEHGEGAALEMRVLPETWHASFDRRSLFAERARPVAQILIDTAA